jgi:hypothetical protein
MAQDMRAPTGTVASLGHVMVVVNLMQAHCWICLLNSIANGTTSLFMLLSREIPAYIRFTGSRLLNASPVTNIQISAMIENRNILQQVWAKSD